MTVWLYRPGHPMANENGMVDSAMAGPCPKDGEAPYVISDIIDATWHPATGQRFDSKSNFRRATKASGCEEVGTSRQTDRREIAVKTKEVARDVIEAVKKVNQGYRPDPDKIPYGSEGWQ